MMSVLCRYRLTSCFKQKYIKDDNFFIFQHDNDPKHTATLTKQWFTTNEVFKLDWPSQSPDLNPIENLWSLLDRSLVNRAPQNEQQLFQCLKDGWNALPKSYLQDLIESMPRRCQAVIESKGNMTKY